MLYTSIHIDELSSLSTFSFSLGVVSPFDLAPPWDVKCCWARGRNWGRGSLASSASQFPPYRKYSLSKTRRKLQMFSCVFLWSPVMLAGYSCVRIQRPLRNHFPMRVTIRLRRLWGEIKCFRSDLSLSAIPPTTATILFNKYLWVNFTGQVRLSHSPCSVFFLELKQMNRNKGTVLLGLALGDFASLNPVSLRTIPDVGSLSHVCVSCDSLSRTVLLSGLWESCPTERGLESSSVDTDDWREHA